jgi:lipid II:glycine glycyltransferase (peptidoglycan interpeptide bridge formation enzyme)
MISFVTCKFPIKRKLILFSEKPSIKYGILDEYMHSFCTKPIFGLKRFPKYTKLIDLSDGSFSNDFHKITNQQIRKARTDGIQCRITDNIKEFVYLNNRLIEEKKISGLLSEEELRKYGDAFLLRVAYINENQILVYHSYLYDSSIKRVRCMHSVSRIHDENTTQEEKALTSRANRLLHYEDMLYFREQGCITYDFGGYAYNSADKGLLGINNFKDTFGGVLVEESIYIPYIIYIIKNIRKHIHGLINLRKSKKEGND